MPYIQYPLGKDRSDYRTITHTAIDNADMHDRAGKLIVTGRADFAADRMTGHKYFAVPVCSTVAYGTVKKIDFSEAEKITGVIKCVDAVDVPSGCGAGTGQIITSYGQEIGFVIADNWYTALRAANKVTAEYEGVRTDMVDPDVVLENKDKLDPIKGGLATIVMDRGGNLERGGGADNGWSKCDWTFETHYPWTTSYAHNELESHQAIAWWVKDEVYVYCGTQYVFSAHSTVVSALGIPNNKCHMYSPFNCGGFGGKTGGLGVVEAAVLSKLVGGYPVLFKNTRKTNVLTRKHNFSIRSTTKVGGTKDGKIVAMNMQMYSNDGKTASCPCNAGVYGLKTTWNIPYLTCNVYGINTTTPERGYWRDVADPPGGDNTEPVFDKVAYYLKKDPLDIRLLNAFDPDQVFDSVEVGTTSTPGTQPFGSMHIKELLNFVAEWSDWKSKYHVPASKQLSDGRYHGIAISSHMDSHGSMSGSSRGGIVKAMSNGKFQVVTASARGCAGGTTVCCAVTAEVLGAKEDDVLLGRWAETDSCLDSGIQAGSTHTVSISSAFYNAAMELRYKLFTAALSNAVFKGKVSSIDDLEAIDSVIYAKADHTLSLPYSKVCNNYTGAAAAGYNATVARTADPMNDLFGQRNGGAWKDKYYNGKKYISKDDAVRVQGSSAAVCEVAVDTENGQVEILNYYLALDTGCTIFKQGMLRELGAGTELFHNQGFYYGDVYDESTGALISTNYTEAQFATYKDIDFSNLHFTDVQTEDAGGPFGCHGISEPMLTNFCTLYQAIFNAIGVWVDPEKGGVTADKVLKSIKKAGGVGAHYQLLLQGKDYTD